MRGLKPWDKTHYLNSENTQHPGCLFFFWGDDKLPSYIYYIYMGIIIISHCKDSYEPTSIMESKSVYFFHGSFGT